MNSEKATDGGGGIPKKSENSPNRERNTKRIDYDIRLVFSVQCSRNGEIGEKTAIAKFHKMEKNGKWLKSEKRKEPETGRSWCTPTA